jgi:translation initiation factor 4E
MASLAGGAAATAKPLQFKWSFWEQRISSSNRQTDAKDWKNLQQLLCTVNTVEDFWHYFNALPKPSDVFSEGKMRRRVGKEGEERVIESFALFKSGIEPSWEDDSNIRGGEWVIRKQPQPVVLDRWWENLVSSSQINSLV